MITSEQIRGARAMLRWEQKELSEQSGVSLATIKRLEGRPGTIEANRTTTDALERALEAAGVIFVAENGDGPGVRLRKGVKAAPSVAEPKAEAVIAKGRVARGKAEKAVDKALAALPADDEEKTARKRRLTQVPEGLGAKPAKPRGSKGDR